MRAARNFNCARARTRAGVKPRMSRRCRTFTDAAAAVAAAVVADSRQLGAFVRRFELASMFLSLATFNFVAQFTIFVVSFIQNLRALHDAPCVGRATRTFYAANSRIDEQKTGLMRLKTAIATSGALVARLCASGNSRRCCAAATLRLSEARAHYASL